jgi:hypothetical protein
MEIFGSLRFARPGPQPAGPSSVAAIRMKHHLLMIPPIKQSLCR